MTNFNLCQKSSFLTVSNLTVFLWGFLLFLKLSPFAGVKDDKKNIITADSKTHVGRGHLLRLEHLRYGRDICIMVGTVSIGWKLLLLSIYGARFYEKRLYLPPVHVANLVKNVNNYGFNDIPSFCMSLSAFHYMNCPHCDAHVHTKTVHVMINYTIYILKS